MTDYATTPHTTLSGDPSVPCPHGCAVHGTASEIVHHLEAQHGLSRTAADRVSGHKVAQYIADVDVVGGTTVALRILAAVDEILIRDVAASLTPIATPAGDLIPGETVTLVLFDGVKRRRINGIRIGPNRYPDASPERLKYVEQSGIRGYNTVRYRQSQVVDIIR